MRKNKPHGPATGPNAIHNESSIAYLSQAPAEAFVARGGGALDVRPAPPRLSGAARLTVSGRTDSVDSRNSE
ncbi:hypothetical protein B7486_20315 [cyanobacterium TDX16]|nr:hypothetical protein B7486_20315 [cyanobacterium TDX16]